MKAIHSSQRQVQLQKFKKIFEDQKATLLHPQQVHSQDLTLGSDALSDELDLSSMEREQNLTLKLRSREALFTKKIDSALAKISAGTFGICECCDEEIEFSRLEARPTAELCIVCKEKEEALEHRVLSTEQNKKQILRLA